MITARFCCTFLTQSRLIFRCIEAVIHRKILQDFITGLTEHRTAIPQHILDGLAHHLRHTMCPHDFTAKLTGNFDGELAAVHHILRALQQLKYGRIIFRHHCYELRPDLADTIFNINDILVEYNPLQITLALNLLRRPL